MDLHLGGVGEVEQLPGQAQLHIVSGKDEVRQGVKVLRLRVGIAVAQLPGLVGEAAALLRAPVRQDLLQHQGELDPLKIGGVRVRDVDVVVVRVVLRRIGGGQCLVPLLDHHPALVRAPDDH